LLDITDCYVAAAFVSESTHVVYNSLCEGKWEWLVGVITLLN